MSLSVFKVDTDHPGFSHPCLTSGAIPQPPAHTRGASAGLQLVGGGASSAPHVTVPVCVTPFGASWREDSRPAGKGRRRKPFSKCCQSQVPETLGHIPSRVSPLSPPQIQTALRHKSEIEHHRNKIRLRAKRRGHYEFPVVDELSSGDTRERHRVYRRAQMQIDKILDPTASVPSVFIEPRKRWGSQGRGRMALLSQLGVGGTVSLKMSQRGFYTERWCRLPGRPNPSRVVPLCGPAALTLQPSPLSPPNVFLHLMSPRSQHSETLVTLSFSGPAP